MNIILNEFDKLKVEKIICCGDIIGIGINPEETVQKLISIKNKLIAVRGNHEQYLLNGLPKQIHDNKRKLTESEINNHIWNHSQLSTSSIDFLKQLKSFESINIGGKNIFIVHYPMLSNGTYKKHIKNPNYSDIIYMFKEFEANIYLYGHTHTYSVNNFDNKWYINPGSLGCPAGSSFASAGLLDIKDGEIEFKSINIEYNVKEVIDEINSLKIPHYEEILKTFYLGENQNA